MIVSSTVVNAATVTLDFVVSPPTNPPIANGVSPPIQPGHNFFPASSFDMSGYAFSSTNFVVGNPSGTNWNFWKQTISSFVDYTGIRGNEAPDAHEVIVQRTDGGAFTVNSLTFNFSGQNNGEPNFAVIKCVTSDCSIPVTDNYTGLTIFDNTLPSGPGNLASNVYKVTLDSSLIYQLQSITLTSSTPVPLPAALPLWATAMAGVSWAAGRRRDNKSGTSDAG